MLPSACGLGQHFQDLGHSFSLYGPPSRQITYISSHVKRSPSLWLHNKSHLFHRSLSGVYIINRILITCPLRSLVRYRVEHARSCNILYLSYFSHVLPSFHILLPVRCIQEMQRRYDDDGLGCSAKCPQPCLYVFCSLWLYMLTYMFINLFPQRRQRTNNNDELYMLSYSNTLTR